MDFDYLYALGIVVLGIVMMTSPESFLGRAKYNDDRVKTESFLKKTGIVIIICGLVFAVFVFLR